MENPVNIQVKPLRLSDLAEIQIHDDEKVGYPISYTEEQNDRLTEQYASEQLTLNLVASSQIILNILHQYTLSQHYYKNQDHPNLGLETD